MLVPNPDERLILLSGLLRYLEKSAERFPEKTAFADENESVTFSELQELGRSIGAAISERAQGLNLPVAVLTNHRVTDVAAFIGTLYAGCFYVPLDGGAPKEYLESRLKTISPAVTIEAATIAGLPRAEPNTSALAAIRGKILSTDPAYAIFTSGSTGIPKAAAISHNSVVNLTEWMKETFNFTELTVFAGQCPFYFDSSVQEIYSTLKNGATTHLFPRKLFLFPLKAMKYVQELGANTLPWSAAAVKMTAGSGVFEHFVPAGIEDVIFGGENMPAKVLNIWKKAMPKARFTNVYGPSETTVDCAYYTVDREFPDSGSIPIGRPCRNVELLLLDEGFKPAPDGETGEIYVRGAGVGLGYWRDPARTTEVFIQNPLNSLYRDIVYRTGDLAMRNEYGELVFLSRVDQQVKHMGSRVELGEVETAAAGLDGVRLACCLYDKEKGRILLFYEGDAAEHDISVILADRLPRYMCPNVVIKTDHMPAMPNGKIDRMRVMEEYFSGL